MTKTESASVDILISGGGIAGLTAAAARPRHHVERHAQHPVTGGGPDHRERDPEPEVREGPHVDGFQDAL